MKSAIKTSSGKGIFRRLDWVTTVVPFLCVSILCLFFMMAPEKSAHILDSIRFLGGSDEQLLFDSWPGSPDLFSLYGVFAFWKDSSGEFREASVSVFSMGIHDVYRRSCGGYFVLFPV